MACIAHDAGGASCVYEKCNEVEGLSDKVIRKSTCMVKKSHFKSKHRQM